MAVMTRKLAIIALVALAAALSQPVGRSSAAEADEGRTVC
jgi:hypothetical protein